MQCSLRTLLDHGLGKVGWYLLLVSKLTITINDERQVLFLLHFLFQAEVLNYYFDLSIITLIFLVQLSSIVFPSWQQPSFLGEEMCCVLGDTDDDDPHPSLTHDIGI